MTDDPAAGSARSPAPVQQATISMLSQYLKDLSFENLQPPDFLERRLRPRGEASVDLTYEPLAATQFELSLKMKADAGIEGKPAYIIELDYRGRFEITGPGQPDVDRILSVRGASLLFPFARAIIYQTTLDGGFPALSIQPVDFAALHRRRRLALARASGSTPPATVN